MQRGLHQSQPSLSEIYLSGRCLRRATAASAERAARAGCGSAVHGEPAYCAQQSCRKSQSCCQWQERRQLLRLTLVWPPFMVTPSLSPLCSHRQHVVFCLPTSGTAGCTGRWNTLWVQRVFLVLFFLFFPSRCLLLRLPITTDSRLLALSGSTQPKAVCGATAVTL